MFVPVRNVAAPSGELLIVSRRRLAVEFAKRIGSLAAGDGRFVRFSVIRACIDSSKKFGGARGSFVNHFPSLDSVWRNIIDSPANNPWNFNISCQSLRPPTPRLQGAEPGGPPTSNRSTGRLGLLWHEAFTGFVMTFASRQRLHLLVIVQSLDRVTNSHPPHTSNDLSVLPGVHRARLEEPS